MRAGNTVVVLIKLIPTLKLAISTARAPAFQRTSAGVAAVLVTGAQGSAVVKRLSWGILASSDTVLAARGRVKRAG